jgi:hypothetical protein
MDSVRVTNFKGLEVDKSPTVIHPDASPDCSNVTLSNPEGTLSNDEIGFQKYNSTGYGASIDGLMQLRKHGYISNFILRNGTIGDQYPDPVIPETDWNDWGESGTGDYQFLVINGSFYDPTNDLLVCSDTGNNRIAIFKPDLSYWKVLDITLLGFILKGCVLKGSTIYVYVEDTSKNAFYFNYSTLETDVNNYNFMFSRFIAYGSTYVDGLPRTIKIDVDVDANILFSFGFSYTVDEFTLTGTFIREINSLGSQMDSICAYNNVIYNATSYTLYYVNYDGTGSGNMPLLASTTGICTDGTYVYSISANQWSGLEYPFNKIKLSDGSLTQYSVFGTGDYQISENWPSFYCTQIQYIPSTGMLYLGDITRVVKMKASLIA